MIGDWKNSGLCLEDGIKPATATLINLQCIYNLCLEGDKMIDWTKSADLNMCTIEWLKARFIRFSHSKKRIITICDRCGVEREISFYQYRDLCHKCANGTPEHRAAMSAMKIQYHIDHPEVGKAHSERLVQYYTDHPEAGIAHSEKLMMSDAMKAEQERQRGGNDMLNHHMIYDHADLTKHVMPMTRAMHSRLHRVFEANGIEIPHINTKETA